MSIDSRLSLFSTTYTEEQAMKAASLHFLIAERDEGRLIECLDDGFIRLVEHMGSDRSIVRAARVSYGDGTKTPSDDRTLIRYLMRHRHTTPFEMCEVLFHVRVPMDCWRQWIRHRTASVNEYSTRYSEAIDAAAETKEWRLQATDNKQGSQAGKIEWPDGYELKEDGGGRVVLDGAKRAMMYTPFDTYDPGSYLTAREYHLQRQAREVYDERLAFGVAREQARKDLPLSTYTEAYWKMDLKNLFHFLQLRMDSHAQLEIRTYAEAIAKLIQPLFPMAFEAFKDYCLKAVTLSWPEIGKLRSLLRPEWTTWGKDMSHREEAEFAEKLRLFGVPMIELTSNAQLAT